MLSASLPLSDTVSFSRQSVARKRGNSQTSGAWSDRSWGMTSHLHQGHAPLPSPPKARTSPLTSKGTQLDLRCVFLGSPFSFFSSFIWADLAQGVCVAGTVRVAMFCVGLPPLNRTPHHDQLTPCQVIKERNGPRPPLERRLGNRPSTVIVFWTKGARYFLLSAAIPPGCRFSCRPGPALDRTRGSKQDVRPHKFDPHPRCGILVDTRAPDRLT